MDVENSTMQTKDEALREKYLDRKKAEIVTQITLQRMQKDFVMSINAYAVVLVLLASVTFVGFLQPPGGLQALPPHANTTAPSAPPSNDTSDDKPQFVMQRREMIIFIVFNSLSFVLSVADLLLCVLSSLSPLRSISTSSETEDWIPAYEGHFTLQSEQSKTKLLAHYVSSTLVKLIFVNAIFAISLTCCVVAFGAAGLSVVPKSVRNANFLAVVGTLIVGSVLFAVLLVWLLIYTFKFMKRAVSDESLSTSLQARARNPQVQFRYLNAHDKD